MTITEIMEWLPHRYPFLLIDGIVKCRSGESISAWKNVTANEPFFQGHFPGRPVMPGVLIIEAMAQAGGVLSYMSSREQEPDTIFYLAGVDEARFRRPVTPGDRLDLEIAVDGIRRGIWFYRCEATVAGKKAVSARITCAPGTQAATRA
ncbi:MAG TPA: 3-hydroxyacyl-ACP dehydratase FabZ [Woeseiaceae bacterium]|nr:3-hydroxyacyl-ACP dehydratase FabZ [Woeseiaceae bacterium]